MPQKKRKYDDIGQVVGAPASGGGKYGDIAQVVGPPQTQQPPTTTYGTAKNLGLGAEKTVYGSFVPAALTGLEALGSAMTGDLGPAREVGELALRGAAGFLMGGNPSFGAPAIVNEEAMRRIQAGITARHQGDPIYGAVEQARQQVEREASLDPSLRGRVERGVGEYGTAALPAVATGIATGGSVPAIAGVTALQSLDQPQNMALNVALASAPVPAGKFVAPILRRIRGARGAVAGVEEAAAATSRASVAEENILRVEMGLPRISEAPARPFGVSAGKSYQSASVSGPSAQASFAFDVADASLANASERTPLLQTVSALYKAGLLTGAKTHIKNVGGNLGFQLSEELSRVPGSIADMVMGLRSGQRTYTGANLSSVARSSYEAATEGIAQAKQILRNGVSDADLGRLGLTGEINSGSKIIDGYVNGVFRLLSAEDKVFKSYAMRRALEDRAKALALTEIRQGKLARGSYRERFNEIMQAPPEDIAAGAVADAEIATFNEANKLAAGVQAFKGKLGPGGRLAADLIIPFEKTPANIIKRLLEYSFGTITGGQGIARTLAREAFTPAEQRAFAQAFGRGTVGAGLIALGWKLYDKGLMTGLAEDQPSLRNRDAAAGRIPGAIRIGDTWHQVSGFSPIGNLIAIGATLARETSQEYQAGQEREAIWKPALDTLTQTVGEAPLAIGAQQIASALREPGSTGAKLLGGIAGGFVPTLASDVAEAVDPQQRQATSLADRVLKRVPVARQTLPAATDVLGQPRQDYGPIQAMFDPTKGTTDLAQRVPLFRELVRLDYGISGFKKKPDESNEAYQAKVDRFGRLYTQYGVALISTPQYQSATDQLRRKAFENLNEGIKRLIGEGREAIAPGRLNPYSVTNSARESLRREQQKRR